MFLEDVDAFECEANVDLFDLFLTPNIDGCRFHYFDEIDSSSME